MFAWLIDVGPASRSISLTSAYISDRVEIISLLPRPLLAHSGASAGEPMPSYWLHRAHGCAQATRATPSPPGAVRVVAIAAMRLDSAEQRIVGVALIGAAIERLA